MQFHIENMTCGRKVVVTSNQPRAAFEAALAEAGFPAAPEETGA